MYVQCTLYTNSGTSKGNATTNLRPYKFDAHFNPANSEIRISVSNNIQHIIEVCLVHSRQWNQ